MKTRSLLVVGATLSLLLAGCGSDPAPVSGTEAGESDTAGTGSFPATITHQYGETVVPEEPQRVVSVGLTEQDVLLQMGVVPVAITDWYGEQPFGVWPWATELLGDAEPEVLSVTDGFEFERIAALEPDLIVGTNSGMSQKDYDLLSAIAPTIAHAAGSVDTFSPWQEQTLLIAQGLGREAEGQALIDDAEARFAEIAQAHPEWEGMTATFSQGAPYDGNLYVYPDGLSTDFLTDLGFAITAGLEDYSPDGYQALISAENVGEIEADVIVFATESEDNFEALQKFGTVPDLAAVQEDRAVYTDDVLAGAIYFATPLSLDYVLDELTPMLEAATAGEAPREYPS